MTEDGMTASFAQVQTEEQIDESDMQRIGELYYDEETGTYYAIMGD